MDVDFVLKEMYLDKYRMNNSLFGPSTINSFLLFSVLRFVLVASNGKPVPLLCCHKHYSPSSADVYIVTLLTII